jgi:hypothetical protein
VRATVTKAKLYFAFPSRSLGASRPLKRYPTNGFEHFFAGIRFSEVRHTPQSFGCSPHFGIVMGRNKNNGGTFACRRELLREFYAGHASELDVQHQAPKLRMLPVCEKRFRRLISDCLKSRGTQQPTEGSANILVVLNNGHVGGSDTVH